MSLEKIIEEKIQEAIANGEFDNLEGAGKPINLDDYFATPEDIRVGQALLKSNKFVPEEVDLLKEIGQLREQIKVCRIEPEKAKLTNLLNEKTLALTIILERNKRKKY
ncbi:MAG TPA: DUF1992 domain-containing protein [Pyrinomonadaceae bacterium]|nr:DUF1992 domain-containing protein [Pyrinomonadaceae bacterium]